MRQLLSSFRSRRLNSTVSSKSLLPWRLPEEGELLALADARDIVMVAGQDSYACKGIEHLMNSMCAIAARWRS